MGCYNSYFSDSFIYNFMKYLILLFFLFFCFSNTAHSDELIALKGIKEVGLQVEQIDKVCDIDHNDVDRNVRYILSNSKINVSNDSQIQLYIYPIIIEDPNGTYCAASIVFQVYGLVEATLIRGNPLEGPFPLYERFGVVGNNPADFADYYLKYTDEVTKQFVADWSTVNPN